MAILRDRFNAYGLQLIPKTRLKVRTSVMKVSPHFDDWWKRCRRWWWRWCIDLSYESLMIMAIVRMLHFEWLAGSVMATRIVLVSPLQLGCRYEPIRIAAGFGSPAALTSHPAQRRGNLDVITAFLPSSIWLVGCLAEWIISVWGCDSPLLQ